MATMFVVVAGNKNYHEPDEVSHVVMMFVVVDSSHDQSPHEVTTVVDLVAMHVVVVVFEVVMEMDLDDNGYSHSCCQEVHLHN